MGCWKLQKFDKHLWTMKNPNIIINFEIIFESYRLLKGRASSLKQKTQSKIKRQKTNKMYGVCSPLLFAFVCLIIMSFLLLIARYCWSDLVFLCVLLFFCCACSAHVFFFFFACVCVCVQSVFQDFKNSRIVIRLDRSSCPYLLESVPTASPSGTLTRMGLAGPKLHSLSFSLLLNFCSSNIVRDDAHM